MKSAFEVDSEKFNEFLKVNVERGTLYTKRYSLNIVFFIFTKTDKMFFGMYGKNKFEITETFEYFPNMYRISGDYKLKSNNQTEVNYELKPLGFVYYWNRYMPLIAIPLFNLILYFESHSYDFDNFVVINALMLCILVIIRFYMWRKKRKLEKIFKAVFGIEIKNKL